MKTLLPIILVVGGLILAYLGISTYQSSTADVSILGLDISAQDEGGQQTAIIYFVLAILCVGGGVMLYRRA